MNVHFAYAAREGRVMVGNDVGVKPSVDTQNRPLMDS